MTQLDPIFATDPMQAMRELTESVEWITDDIAGLVEDIRGWENDLAEIERELPRMEHRRLELQRDIAVGKLRTHELRAKLAAKNGGQQ